MNGSERQKKHREKLMAEGRCCRCGKPNTTNPGKTKCKACMAFVATKNEVAKNEAYAKGLCKKCKKRPFIQGQKWCEVCRDGHKTWWKTSNYRQRNKILDRQRRKDRKIRIFDHYGNECACCGEKEPYFLSIDHINEDGAKHRAEIMGSAERGRRIGSTIFYKWLDKNDFPDGFQVLCHNCNMGKHMNGGICPHKSDN